MQKNSYDLFITVLTQYQLADQTSESGKTQILVVNFAVSKVPMARRVIGRKTSSDENVLLF